MAKVKGPAPPVIDLPVQFGGVSLGKKNARLGFSVDRSVLGLVRADELFVDRRLTVRIVLGREDDAGGQELAFGEDFEHRGVFDVKGFRVGAEAYTGLGLVAMVKDFDLEALRRFRAAAGRLVVENVEWIPEDEKDDEPDGDERPLLKKSEGPWRSVPLEELFEGRILKALNKHGLSTVGELADETARGDFWAADIKGIGAAARQAIEDRMTEFWAANPQYGDGAADSAD